MKHQVFTNLQFYLESATAVGLDYLFSPEYFSKTFSLLIFEMFANGADSVSSSESISLSLSSKAPLSREPTALVSFQIKLRLEASSTAPLLFTTVTLWSSSSLLNRKRCLVPFKGFFSNITFQGLSIDQHRT